jgi:hypothetical protein
MLPSGGKDGVGLRGMDEQRTLQLAIQSLRGGRRKEGQKLLLEILRANSRHETAWLWLSATISDPAKKRWCLEQVLKINPDNQAAQRLVAKLQAPGPAPTLQGPVPAGQPASTAVDSVARVQPESGDKTIEAGPGAVPKQVLTIKKLSQNGQSVVPAIPEQGTREFDEGKVVL